MSEKLRQATQQALEQELEQKKGGYPTLNDAVIDELDARIKAAVEDTIDSVFKAYMAKIGFSKEINDAVKSAVERAVRGEKE